MGRGALAAEVVRLDLLDVAEVVADVGGTIDGVWLADIMLFLSKEIIHSCSSPRARSC